MHSSLCPCAMCSGFRGNQEMPTEDYYRRLNEEKEQTELEKWCQEHPEEVERSRFLAESKANLPPLPSSPTSEESELHCPYCGGNHDFCPNTVGTG